MGLNRVVPLQILKEKVITQLVTAISSSLKFNKECVSMSCQGTLQMLCAQAMMNSNSSKCNRLCRCTRDSQLVSNNSRVWKLQNLSLLLMKNPIRCLKLCPHQTNTRIINSNNPYRQSKNRRAMHLVTSGAWLTSIARNEKCKRTARHRCRLRLTLQLFLPHSAS